MSFKEKNLEKLTEYFYRSCKKEGEPFKLGVEIEHFVMDKQTGKSAVFKGERGIEKLLELISPNFSEKHFQDGSLVGLDCGEYNITLEPSCQFEISITPKEKIEDIEKIYHEFEDVMKNALDLLDLELVTFGFNPVQKNSEMELIPKKRYEFMDRYFSEIGTKGRYMMRSSASTQISIDYYSEEDFINKYKSAYIIGSLFALMTDNTPVYDGEKNDMHIRRMDMWRNVDQRRVDIFKYLDFDDFGFKDYAGFVLSTPLIVNEKDGKTSYTTKTAFEIYDDREIEKEDIAHILSMVFPMARLKNYIEIRNADSIPINEALKLSAFIKGLYKNPDKLYNYIATLDFKGYPDIEKTENAVMKDGYEAIIYGKKAKDVIDDLMEIAKSNLGDEAYFLALKN